MLGGLCIAQFGLQSYEWLTKSDDHEAGVRFVNHEYIWLQSEFDDTKSRYQLIITVTISENNKYI